MKNLYQDSADFLRIEEEKAPKGTRKPLTAKAIPNDPNDPFVLIQGFGKVRESQAKKLGYNYTKLKEYYVSEDWSTHSEYHSKKLGAKDGMPYEYSLLRYHPDDIPHHWDKEKTIKKWQDDDRSNKNVAGIWKQNDKLASPRGDKIPFKKFTSESVETKLQLTMPLFIRLLEWAKEECKTDVEIHQVAEKIAAVNGVADMGCYEGLLK